MAQQQLTIRLSAGRLERIIETYGSLDNINPSAVFDIGLDLVKELDSNPDLTILNKILMKSARRKLKI
jgi:hypothetical protein